MMLLLLAWSEAGETKQQSSELCWIATTASFIAHLLAMAGDREAVMNTPKPAIKNKQSRRRLGMIGGIKPFQESDGSMVENQRRVVFGWDSEKAANATRVGAGGQGRMQAATSD